MCAGTLNCGSILLSDVNSISHHPIIGPASIPSSMMQKLYIIILLSLSQDLSLSLSMLHTKTSTCDTEMLTQRDLREATMHVYSIARKSLETWLYIIIAAHNLRIWEAPVDTMIVVVRDILLSRFKGKI